MQPEPVARDLSGQLVAAGGQQMMQLPVIEPAVQDLANLLQREAQVLQRDQAVDPAELVGALEPIAGELDHPCRHEQAEPVVVAQHPHRHPGPSGEISDTQHGDLHAIV